MSAAALLSRLRRLFLQGAAIAIMTAVLFVCGGEVLLREFYPQVVMYPRWEASSDFGIVLPKNATMVQRCPGRWEFCYTTNEDRCRGRQFPQTVEKDKTVVVALGDSCTMGIGVNDGEEYPAVLARELGDRFFVLNCGSPGWGLTQETRKFYEFALRYEPRIVILQFNANDPMNGKLDAVTRVDNGKLVFQPTQRRLSALFDTPSKYRIVQASQLYALMRNDYETRRARGNPTAAELLQAEQDYIELLDVFVQDLRNRGIFLIMISVNGHLNKFPAIRDAVTELHNTSMMRYVEIVDWMTGDANTWSPEGHRWGAPAHAALGRELAKIVRETGGTAESQ